MFYDLLTSVLPHYYLGSQTMIILIGFFTLSFVASTFVVAACALSSRVSSQEIWEESYEYTPEVSSWEPASPTAS